MKKEKKIGLVAALIAVCAVVYVGVKYIPLRKTNEKPRG